MRGGGQENQLLILLISQILQQAVTLLLVLVGASRFGTGMRFIHNHEVWAMVQEDVSLVTLLDIINRNDLVRDVTEHILVWTQFFLQTADGRRTDNVCIQAKLVLDFILPLLAKVWQAYYCETVNFVAVE